jgi:hypothetical protein
MDSPPSFPFPLSLSTSQHRESQHIHLAVSLSTEGALILLTENKITSFYVAHLKLFTISLNPA